ncbi:hypothetical protein BG74_03025 [Sodalis-like endosymbiont of Proechinophthirus fluctus]|uniref:C40 family peptidase n=1 Tax=Sodalis-like endosymbiont of Proechinophthirus fluctus TaxID=1462730 RepID=UPI0007A883E4|nr:C40 family peptidase [Sodalis-like endosymbiont of Proechinophthirus fluctus]KYP97487.1 hypothetical protein BG74_03025 [Sodalis-like endosymbiont of Proechinophthirus fluctus]
MRLCFTLFLLLFTQFILNLSHAAPNAGANADKSRSQANTVKADDQLKLKPVKLQKKTRSTESEHLGNTKLKSGMIKPPTPKVFATKTSPSVVKAGKSCIMTSSHCRGGARFQTAAIAASAQPLRMSENHKVRYQRAKLIAMAKLMSQVGKPYRWGGKSPTTGFDCSGLIYYAYKDLIRVPLPRTANEMYHLRDAAPVKKSELESGDLVFFRIRNRGAADHVGVYLGNGRFIQSPCTGRDIRISYLSEGYWQEHYVGARRVMTPTTIR